MMYDREEIVWVAEGVRALLLGTNGTDRFPEDFYRQVKEMTGWTHG